MQIMFNFAPPLLGNTTSITITSNDPVQSLPYYQQLGFQEVMRSDYPFPWVLVSDGALLILLRKENTAQLSLSYYNKDLQPVIADLENKGISFTIKPKDTDALKRYVLQSPDGLNIGLIQLEGFQQPAGPTMARMQQQDYFRPDAYVNKTCGMFGELAHPVKDLNASITFWKLLGYSLLSSFTSPYNWAIMSDGLGIVGLHQTNEFNYPAITYFAADMKDKINRLAAAGLGNYKERGPGNIILTTPEQQHIFLFSMGM